MRRFWWWFRLALLCVVTLGLGTYLLVATPWRNWLGLAPDYSAQIAQGDPIVTAIYGFKAERGLWPEYLDDLVPEYLPKAPGRQWFYELSSSGRPHGQPRELPSLSTAATQEGLSRAHLGYDFDPTSPAWRIFGDADQRIIRKGRPTGAPTTQLSADERTARQLKELDRRLQKEPGILDHWMDKAGLLVSLDRLSEASTVVDEASMNLPESAWPWLAQAALDLRQHKASTRESSPETGAATLPAPIEQFKQWVNDHPSFTRWYDLYWLCRQWGGPDSQNLATDAARQALGQAIEVDSDDRHIAAYYLWDLSRWALKTGQWDLALAICQTWEKAHADGRVHEQSYLAIRAGAELAKGDLTAARADIEAAQKAGPIWAKNLDPLATAINRGDRTFKYDPGATPGELEVFETPE